MTDLEHYREPTPAPGALTFATVPQALELADRIAGTEFVPSGLRNRPEAVVAAMLTGVELGLPPMTALSKIHVVDGRPSIAAELMRALVLNAGHELWIEESSNTKVTLGGRRKGSEHATRITWTIDDARKAGLERKNNWAKYPRAMLTARATSELCRMLFADVLAGISYSVEEVRDGFDLEADDETFSAPADLEDLDGRPADVPPAPEPSTKRTARKQKPKSSSKSTGRRAPDPAPAPPAPPLPGEAGTPAEPIETKPVGSGDHEAGDVVAGPSGPTYTPAQALAIRAREVGLSDDERHGLNLALTGGRTSSGNDLDREEVSGAFEVLDQIDAGAAKVVRSTDGEVVVWSIIVAETGTVVFEAEVAAEAGGSESLSEPREADPAQLPDEPKISSPGAVGTDSEDVSTVGGWPTSEEDWRSFLRQHGAKVADALRAASTLTEKPPKSLRALAEDRELSEKVAQILEERS